MGGIVATLSRVEKASDEGREIGQVYRFHYGTPNHRSLNL